MVGLFLLLAMEASGQTTTAEAERFGTDGLAHVVVSGRSFYIDTQGNRAFDAYENPDQPWLIPADEGDSAKAYIVVRDGLKGLRSVQGKWVLPPEFEQVEFYTDDCWKLTKAGKQTFVTPKGELLPYFEEARYLDGRYFDVKTDGKWGIYDSRTQRMAVPAVYDGFDYCGGCGRKSDYVYAQQNGKWGVIDFNNNVRVPFAYEHGHWGGMRSDAWISSFSKNGKSLFVNIPTGKEFAADDDEWMEILSGGELVVEINGKYGLIDTLCREVLPPVYARIATPNPNDYRGYYGPYAIVEKDRKKGVYESGQGIIIQPEWDEVRVYDDYFVLARDGQYGLYDRTGNALLPPGYTDITHINDYFYSSGSEGIAIFKTKQKALYGLFFAETGVEIPPGFHEIDLKSLSYGQEATRIAGEFQGEEAVFDFNGNELLPLGYEEWEPLDTASARYLMVTKQGKRGVYDTQSKNVVIPLDFDHIRPFPGAGERVLAVTSDNDDNRYGVYALDGSEMLPPVFSAYNEVAGIAGLFSGDPEGSNAVLIDGRNGAKTTLPARYTCALENTVLVLISDDSTRARLYHPVEKRIVNDLEFAFPYSYATDNRLAYLQRFASNGLAWVQTGGLYGLIDTTGRWVRKPFYDKALDFDGKKRTVGAKAYPASDWRSSAGYVAYQFIGSDGQPLINQVYTGPNEFLMDMDYFVGNYLVIRDFDAETGGLYMGLADTVGKVILPPVYDVVEAFNGNRYFLLQKGQKFGIAGSDGRIILPVEFDNLLLNRYDKEAGITFPLLGYRSAEWKYYTENGDVLQVKGVGDKAWSVNTGFW
ncbi:hypothetical protein GCM10011386_37230 [Parapedobacter defluvii]|uniref:WG containing repeat-containing protein n=2 Tax=Parapedobacter defluvii TaxID=2045106 RepID=A0ABQ1MRF1_9SPHI|nr:hypothetical protein GCM10011386_37230 [Parapedobacter defluvii]